MYYNALEMCEFVSVLVETIAVLCIVTFWKGVKLSTLLVEVVNVLCIVMFWKGVNLSLC